MSEEHPGGEKDATAEQFHLEVEKIVSIYVSQDNLTIYENPWVVENTSNGMQDPGTSQLPVPVHGEHTASFRAAVGLGLMCFLLLTVIIGLTVVTVQFNIDRNRLRAEMVNLKKDRECLNGTVCTNNWRCLGNSCYRVSRRKRTWMDARRKCKKDHSHLLVINSDEEQKFILELIPKEMIGPVWIGLSTNDNGEWQWEDGAPLSPQHNITFQDNWQSDTEETSGMDRLCAGASQHGCHVSPCDEESFWMCERERKISDKP